MKNGKSATVWGWICPSIRSHSWRLWPCPQRLHKILLIFPTMGEALWTDGLMTEGPGSRLAWWGLSWFLLPTVGRGGKKGSVKTLRKLLVPVSKHRPRRHQIKARMKSSDLGRSSWNKLVAFLSLSFQKIPNQTHWREKRRVNHRQREHYLLGFLSVPSRGQRSTAREYGVRRGDRAGAGLTQRFQEDILEEILFQLKHEDGRKLARRNRHSVFLAQEIILSKTWR